MSMLSTDPIADMLTRIRNAISVGKTQIVLPHSKVKEVIATALQQAGYLTSVTVLPGKPQPSMQIVIAESDQNSVITEIVRISKPGRRVYAKANDIPRIKNGRGIVLVSTSQGIMTGQQAAKARLGGELICKVY